MTAGGSHRAPGIPGERRDVAFMPGIPGRI